MSKKKIVTVEEEIEMSAEPANAKLSYDAEFEDFLNGNKQAESTYKIHIFGKKNEKGLVGRNKYEYLQTVEGYVPDWDQLGEEFGGGTYQLNGAYTGKDGKRHSTCRVITISDRFTKKEGLLKGVAPAASSGEHGILLQLLQSQNQQLMTGMMNMMDRALAPQDNKGSAKLQEQLNAMMIGSATTQMELINKMANKNLKDAQLVEVEEERDETTLVGEIFELLMWVWNEHGQKLLNAPKILQRKAKKQIHESGELDEILHDPKIYKAAYDKVCEKVPEADIKELLKIVDVPSPDELNLIPMEKQA